METYSIKHVFRRLVAVLGLSAVLFGGLSAVDNEEASAGVWKCYFRVACMYHFNAVETDAFANWSPDHDSNASVEILADGLGVPRYDKLFKLYWRLAAQRARAHGNCIAMARFTGLVRAVSCP